MLDCYDVPFLSFPFLLLGLRILTRDNSHGLFVSTSVIRRVTDILLWDRVVRSSAVVSYGRLTTDA